MTTQQNNQELQNTQDSLSFWSKCCCVFTPCFGFTTCSFLPCMYWLGSGTIGGDQSNNPIHYDVNGFPVHNRNFSKIKRSKFITMVTLFLALILVIISGFISIATIKRVMNHEQRCEFEDRSICTTCIEKIAGNVTIIDVDNKGRGGRGNHSGNHNHDDKNYNKGNGKGNRKGNSLRRLSTTNNVGPIISNNNNNNNDGNSIPYSRTETLIASNTKKEEANSSVTNNELNENTVVKNHHKKHHNPSPTQNLHWAKGTREACVVGDGPLNVGKNHHHKHHHHNHNTTETSIQQDNNVVLSTTTTTTTTYLASCHIKLLNGEKNNTCPFYGKHGEDIIKNFFDNESEGLENPKLLFHCTNDQDCNSICNCLGGNLNQTNLYIKLIVLIISTFLSLSVLFLIIPRLYWHYNALSKILINNNNSNNFYPLSGPTDVNYRNNNNNNNIPHVQINAQTEQGRYMPTGQPITGEPTYIVKTNTNQEENFTKSPKVHRTEALVILNK